MKQNNPSKKRSGMPRLLILLALALFLIAYLTLPAVSRPINKAAAVLGSANVDAVVEYIRSFGAYAMVFSFFLMVFSSVAAPLPAFLITLSNAAIFGWWQGAILSWSSAMARSRPLLLHLPRTGPGCGGALCRKRRSGQCGTLF